MREVSTYGHINKGILTVYKRKEFLESFFVLSDGKDIRVELIIKKLYKKRSNPQNSYHWGYIIIEFCRGWKETYGEIITKDQAHEFLKDRFLFTEVVNEQTGEVVKMSKKSSKLTTVEFMEFNDECGKFINEWFGIIILKPDEQSELMFK